jgi:hypothetical protein
VNGITQRNGETEVERRERFDGRRVATLRERIESENEQLLKMRAVFVFRSDPLALVGPRASQLLRLPPLLRFSV